MIVNVPRKHIDGDEKHAEEGNVDVKACLDDGKVNGKGGQPERDEQFWFDDGTIVLVAGNIKFKVYARSLMEHSPVFRDMLALPQPEGTDASKAPNRPLVHLSDSPHDLRYLFEVLMPAKVLRPFGFPQADVDYNRLSAWVRMGHKYQIDDLVQKSLVFLRQIYPTDVGTYWQANRSATAKRMSPIGVVNIARLTGALDLLPVALMDCCQMESGMVKGYGRGDGTVEWLSNEDLELCMKASGKLIAARVHMMHQLLKIGASKTMAGCRTTTCQQRVQTLWESLTSGAIATQSTPTPLSSWEPFLTTNLPPQRLCATCRADLLKEAAALQRAFCPHLPTIMGVTVEGWGLSASKKPGPAAGQPPPTAGESSFEERFALPIFLLFWALVVWLICMLIRFFSHDSPQQ